MAAEPPLRWGFVGAGCMCSDIALVMSRLGEDKHRIVAIANPFDSSQAQDFSEMWNVPSVYETIDELAEDAQVDIAYVCTVHASHFAACKTLLSAGKPVLVEKTICVHSLDAEELCQLATEKNVFFMEGLWSTHFPAIAEYRKIVAEQRYGQPRILKVNFLQRVLPPRMFDLAVGGGTLYELCIYAVFLVSATFPEETEPWRVRAWANIHEGGCDQGLIVKLEFSGGRYALIHTDNSNCGPCQAELICTDGVVQLGEKFWCPVKLHTPKGVAVYPLPVDNTDFRYFSDSAGQGYQLEEVRRALRVGLKQHPARNHAASLRDLKLLEKISAEIGVVYP